MSFRQEKAGRLALLRRNIDASGLVGELTTVGVGAGEADEGDAAIEIEVEVVEGVGAAPVQ